MILRRDLHPQTKIIDPAKGLVEYVASDETIDAHREVIRANGWRFDQFRKNAPFVDSHDYSTIERQLGKVIDFRVDNGRLVETVQWAVDVPEAKLAQLGFKMTQGGYLKAVSVGFVPVRTLSRWDTDDESRADFLSQLQELGLDESSAPRAIYVEQQQIELSACLIGANPNALATASLARAYKSGCIGDDDLETLFALKTKPPSLGTSALPGADAEAQTRRRREAVLRAIQQITNPGF